MVVVVLGREASSAGCAGGDVLRGGCGLICGRRLLVGIGLPIETSFLELGMSGSPQEGRRDATARLDCAWKSLEVQPALAISSVPLVFCLISGAGN